MVGNDLVAIAASAWQPGPVGCEIMERWGPAGALHRQARWQGGAAAVCRLESLTALADPQPDPSKEAEFQLDKMMVR